MVHRHPSAAEHARRLGSRSEVFLAAGEQLSLVPGETCEPRTLLLAVAVELRLKWYICMTRGGAPEAHDLFRLAGLAEHCGLSLTRDQRDLLLRLEIGRRGERVDGGEVTAVPERDAPAPKPQAVAPVDVRSLCNAITAAAPGGRA